MYELIYGAKGTDDLSIAFDRDRNRRQQELTDKKRQKDKYHIRIYFEDFFGFAEHQEKATFELDWKLTLSRNSDNSVLNKVNAVNIGKTKINAFEWYMLRYTPSILQQAI